MTSRSRNLPSLDTSTSSTSAEVQLTEDSLARLQISDVAEDRPRRPVGFQPHSYAGTGSGPATRGRPPSVTPSTTSVSDGEDEEDEVDLEPLGQSKKEDWLRKGKQKETITVQGTSDASGIAGTLPPEILLHVSPSHWMQARRYSGASRRERTRKLTHGQIFRQLDRQKDVKSCIQVNKTWCLYAFSLLWTRPSITRVSQLADVARVFESDKSLLPYANTVKRINLSAVTSELDINLFAPWKKCTRAERITLSGSDKLSSRAMRDVFSHMPNLVAIDLNKVWACDDNVISTIARGCRDLQGLNINGCSRVGDESMLQIAKNCKLMRRVCRPYPPISNPVRLN